MSSDDEDDAPPSRVRGEPGLHHVANSDDEEESEEEEEEEEDDSEEEGRSKKRKKSNRFVDDEAGEDDSDEDEGPARKTKKKKQRDEDDEESELDEETANRYSNEILAKRNAGLSWVNDLTTEDDLRNRYRQYGDADLDQVEEDGDNVRNSRLPDAATDPKVWCVKVANGTERMVVLQLMNKFITLAKQDNPIYITSAYCNEQVHGFIYVEAMREALVKEALSGLRGVYQSKMKLVPVKEMVDTVTVLRKAQAALVGSWARMRRGKYKGDIAQIINVDPNRNEIEVKLVPRVDTTDYRCARRSRARACLLQC
jgi:transcription elongation factor SPT5